MSSAELGSDRWRALLRIADERGAGWILETGELAVEEAPGWAVVGRFPDNGWTLLQRSAQRTTTLTT